MSLPDPLVPPEVDLRGLPFMPLDVARLRDSGLAIEATGDEFRAAILLWCASWGQVPAGSLPNSDTALATYAGYGRGDLKGWRKVRAGALRGFVECSDGRLYHPVVAEKALDAWAERVEYREAKENEKARKQREREDRKRMFEALRGAGIVLPWNTQTSELRSRYEALPKNVTGHAPVTVTGHAPDTAKTGTGTGTGTGIKDQELSTPDGVLVGAAHQPDPPGDSESDQENPAIRRMAPCPAQAIVDLYHEILPELPQVALLNDSRRRHLQGRWREHEAHRSLEFWRDLFETIRASPFLMGKTPGRNGGTPFRATFDWIIAPTNFVKIVEGNYHA
ncbi:DUF1376 domain-containing protein [Azotobacter salinestris]|uniref:DUF1376 domain-containing protein n=1 Tax=Azotobacter salinestris TaxID=69964 RepID=UPI001266C986|nr:DUF1376 domain-containing protein [Azotobacter salinestris]